MLRTTLARIDGVYRLIVNGNATYHATLGDAIVKLKEVWGR